MSEFVICINNESNPASLITKRFEILGDIRNQTVARAPTGTGGDFEPFATLELCSCGWWLRVGSNHRPHDYESCALTG